MVNNEAMPEHCTYTLNWTLIKKSSKIENHDLEKSQQNVKNSSVEFFLHLPPLVANILANCQKMCNDAIGVIMGPKEGES